MTVNGKQRKYRVRNPFISETHLQDVSAISASEFIHIRNELSPALSGHMFYMLCQVITPLLMASLCPVKGLNQLSAFYQTVNTWYSLSFTDLSGEYLHSLSFPTYYAVIYEKHCGELAEEICSGQLTNEHILFCQIKCYN